MKMRPSTINLSDQYALDDPYGRDFGGEDYITSFLSGRNLDQTFTQAHTRGAYKFVELEDVESKNTFRYEAEVMLSAAKVPYLKLKKELRTRSAARYGVTWEDLSRKEDRDVWIAGSLLQIIDLQSNQIVAERIGYMFDAGLGNQNGGRAPWALAEQTACPSFDKSSSGYPSKTSKTRAFILNVLKPIQGQ